MSKGRLKSKISLKIKKTIGQSKLFKGGKNIQTSRNLEGVISSWSEYYDFLYLVCVVGPEKQTAKSVSLGLRQERALPHIIFLNLCNAIFIKTPPIFLLVTYKSA